MERFAIPGAGGIIESRIEGVDYLLIQERYKDEAPGEAGLVEIPAGKVREFENIFDCLRREIKEETGLDTVEIYGENECEIIEENGYRVISYTPFSCSQNLTGSYPIMVQVFICRVEGSVLKATNETKNMRWASLKELKQLLENNRSLLYPMHISTLKKYLEWKGI